MTSISNLANEIARHVELYTREVKEKVKDAEKKVAKEGVKELKSKSPKRPGSGGYASGWGTVQKDGKTIIVNKKKPQLTHLLEKGHAKANGGRVPGKSHIGPVEDQVNQKYLKEVEGAIRG